MGLMSFFKGVGEKLFGKSEAEVAEKTPELKASALLAHVQGLGLAFNALTVKINGDTVTISGEVDTQEDSEKIALAVGNVEGVSAVDNQMEVSTPAPEARYHTVEKGDSLSKIAKVMYGDAMKYPAIFEANKPMLKDPDLIYPGQVLRIPEL
ncbi:peptidoglycan-binding protein LysM [Lacihabitans sp. CCS-44]|uniref:peptidoglycan-binding protein LysM n=1 Tax=Lacihabitans sp. CCS-44 TaxID=2487331 RepID=UPI0020CDB686|nr:peptidoglycan-binding protein LysM [Lacihabitans sp. CCS-44]MCP9756351.1 peptidoglycan-binding protein LysM [Lacihabitans sp. CCS-44]